VLDGVVADAFLTWREPVLNEVLYGPWVKAGIPFYMMPTVVNPLEDYCVAMPLMMDWFFAANYSRGRGITFRKWLSTLGCHKGLLIGRGWGSQVIPEIPSSIVKYLYRASKICINCDDSHLLTELGDLNYRTFAIPACGGFEISESFATLPLYFEEDEIIRVKDQRDFRLKFNHYCSSEGERKQITLKAMKRVYKDYTLFPFLDRLIEHVIEDGFIPKRNNH